MRFDAILALSLTLILATAAQAAVPAKPMVLAPVVVDRSPDALQRCKLAIEGLGQIKGGSELSKEMIELELSGYRVAGLPENSGCLKTRKFKFVRPIHVEYPDGRSRPTYTLKTGREFTITKEKWIDSGAVEVEYSYIGTGAKGDTPVSDRLAYTINFGERKRERGCASFHAEPAFTVVREECLPPAEIVPDDEKFTH